ncbi:thioredoxin [Paenibacillus anseongense]|uniref:thioredoxin n=1 Tax=Paenibacillus TaxID=44249 RepID=UPI002DB64E91|nr:thioredoxin [Paenibacillus anseongense]MEC0270510.1 thioredoxin [Paenibacillus anseongense]
MDVISLTKDSFHKQIEHGVTLVDFYATWCGPCKIQLPIVEEIAKELKSEATIAKVDIDAESDIASEYDVKSIPTLMIFKDGYKLETFVGVQSKAFLKQKINEYTAIGDTC